MRSAQCLAEGYFRAAIEIAGTTVTIVGSTPSEQQAISQREIDAFWQGGSVPITSLVAVANAAGRVVYGLSPTEIAALSMRFTFMTSATYPADTHRGQTSQINTVAAWNYRNCLQRPPRGRRLPHHQTYPVAADSGTDRGRCSESTLARKRHEEYRAVSPRCASRAS
jgi:NMT1-like family